MEISLNWLSQYIDLSDQQPEQISDILTQTGLEVEGLEKKEALPGGLEGIVVGEVLTCEPHPNADKLRKTTVDVGTGEALPIVCGAPNVAAGQKVIVATVGTMLYPTGGEPFKIKKAKIRGEESQGMICAEDEIGLGGSHDGIMVLNTELPNGTPAADYFDMQPDYHIEIGLTPNRSDATSHIGVARDLRAFLRRDLSIPSVDDFKTDNTSLPVKVTVENYEACPRYSGVTINGVKVEESPEWLKERLRSIGLDPINNIVDITNFVLHETGQPLHAFDFAEIKGGEVRVKTLAEGTKFKTLDEKERTLLGTDLMICNGSDEGMCIGGVFGGINSGLKESSTQIFLESAYFAPDWIRRTAQHHQLKTDASFRFERGTDPNGTLYALKRAALLIKEIAGGEISSELIDLYPSPAQPHEVPVLYKHIDRLIGKQLPRELIHEILDHLDISSKDKSEEGFTAVVATYRVEVLREADIIEEILRIYGLNNIELAPHNSSDFLAEFPLRDPEKIRSEVLHHLAADGFHEIMTNSLTKPVYAEKNAYCDPAENVEMLNKLSEDLGVMRQSLLHTGLEVLAHNINRQQKDLRLFEFGKVYFKKEAGYSEAQRLGIWMTGNVVEENWMLPQREVKFHDLSHMVYRVLNKLRIKPDASEVIHDGVFEFALSLSLKGKELVRAGKVTKAIAKLSDVKAAVFYADFDWELLLKKAQNLGDATPISKFPEVRRDLSLVLDKKTSFAQVEEIAQSREFGLIRKVNVFDVYEGDRIPEDKKAYALSFILQDENKTLNDKMIDRTMSRLMQSFEQKLGAVIRQ